MDTPDSTLADPQQIIDDLRRQLDTAQAGRDESEAQKAALAEILQIINSSAGDLAPVFEAMLEKARLLCDVAHGDLWTYDGKTLHLGATHGEPGFAAWLRQRGPVPVWQGSPAERLVQGADHVQFEDPEREGLFDAAPEFLAQVRRAGVRSTLFVPMRKEGNLLGIIIVYRREVRRFAAKQIALLQNFAVQAVIAMENARLITETREALEQQTATAEVLQVINSSPGDLAPVFNAMVERAARLCEADEALVRTFDGEALHLAAVNGGDAASREKVRQLGSTGLTGLYEPFGRDERVVHIHDVREIDASRISPAGRARLEARRVRTWLAVALHKDDTLLGIINVHRHEVRPFSDRQIALLQNFAAQAVIAMENARLLRETRENLERQTATSHILQAIAAAPNEAEGTLREIAETTSHLFGAAGVTIRVAEGDEYHSVVHVGRGAEDLDTAFGRRMTPNERVVPRSLPGTVLRENRQIHLPDLDRLDPEIADWPGTKILRAGGARTMVGTPLRREGRAVGSLNVWRDELRPFDGAELQLLQSFADQAAIAIENTRLITETREALDQQTATAEVLQVINSSPGDLAPVFDAMLDKALGLCDANFGMLYTYDGDLFHNVGHRGVSAALAELLHEPIRTRWADMQRGSYLREPITTWQDDRQPGSFGRLLRGESIVHDADIADTESYRAGLPLRRALVDIDGARTGLWVALRRDAQVLGAFVIYRKEVRPFSDKQIALLENFAAQAVIAMENARLLTETREALEQQQAMTEVLGIINSSPGNLAPVFDAILEKAHLLCGATVGALFLYDGEMVRAATTHGYPDDVDAVLRAGIRAPAPLLDGGRLMHRHDIRKGADAVGTLISQRGGVRTNLLVPLRKDGVFQGMISCNRQEVRPYTEKEISLIESFAAQATIAMDNARLLDEIRQRQAELRVTFENMGDGVAMFDAEMRLAAWNTNFQRLLDLPDAFVGTRPTLREYFEYMTARGEYGGAGPELEAEIRRGIAIADHESRFERTRPDGRVIEVRRNTVPGGGSVLIFSDITERRRAEEAIRTARDTAEAALGELKLAQANLVQAEKMASLGQLTAGIAHEIKNPLNFVNNFAGLSVELLDELKAAAAPALEALGEDTRAEIDETVEMLTGNLEKIAEHGRRADGIVKSMLEHSRGASGERRSVDLNVLIEEALNLAYHGARAQDQSFNITLDRDFAGMIAPVELVPQDVTRVFLNLFGNGFYAATKRAREANGGAFKPVLKVTTRDLGNAIEVLVRDNGTGIPPEIKDKLFQPFFTTKPTGEGTGLGLSISYDIVTQQHGGTIEVASEPGQYTEFTVRLPRSRGSPATKGRT